MLNVECFRPPSLKPSQICARTFLQSRSRFAFQHEVFDAEFFAILPLTAFITVFIHRVMSGFIFLISGSASSQPSPLEINACVTYLIEPAT